MLSVIGALGPITPTELARRLGMAPTTVSSWLVRLEHEGVASRHANPDDGRSQLVELTEDGTSASFRRVMPDFRRAVGRVRDALGDDLDDVLDALDASRGGARAQVLAANTSS